MCTKVYTAPSPRQSFRLADLVPDLVPPPRKHRHRYHEVFAPNHKLWPVVTALATRECRQAAGQVAVLAQPRVAAVVVFRPSHGHAPGGPPFTAAERDDLVASLLALDGAEPRESKQS